MLLNWMLALICTAIFIFGVLFGATAVLLICRYRRRRLMISTRANASSADIVFEEYATQMTAEEKQILSTISSNGGSVSLKLTLPETPLQLPMSRSLASLCSSSVNTSQKSLLSLVPGLQAVRSLSEKQTADSERNLVPQQSENDQHVSPLVAKENVANADHECKEYLACKSDTYCDDVHTESVTENGSGPRLQGLGLSSTDSEGKVALKENVRDQLADSQSLVADVADNTSQPLGTASRPTSRKPPAMVINAMPASWSPPIDEPRVPTVANSNQVTSGDDIEELDSGAMEAVEDLEDITDYQDSSYIKQRKRISDVAGFYPPASQQPCFPMQKSAAPESSFEALSYINTPRTPHTLASPCGSNDYVFIPPSPSISSLYETSVYEHSILNQSQAMISTDNGTSTRSMAKSSSSPGCISGSNVTGSLFSPPPVHFHQRYFESQQQHRMFTQKMRGSSDHVSST